MASHENVEELDSSSLKRSHDEIDDLETPLNEMDHPNDSRRGLMYSLDEATSPQSDDGLDEPTSTPKLAVKRSAAVRGMSAQNVVSIERDAVPSQPTRSAPDELEEAGADERRDEWDDAHDPNERIENFDWDDLALRYHERVKELNANETAILQEYTHLSQSFAIWAQSGPKQEVNQSYKRLKTQIKYVRNEEYQLEQKRLHYIKVVNAFQSALQLLGS